MNRTEYDMKNCLLWAGILFLLVQPIQAAEWGTLSGQFIYNGIPDKPKKLEITKDENFYGKFKEHIVDESLVIGKKGGIKNIFVYLRTPKLKDEEIHASYQKIPKIVFLYRQNCIFKPHAGGLWNKNQKLKIMEKDGMIHSIHPHLLNHPPESKLPLLPDYPQTYDFYTDEPLPVRIDCDIHPWESAYLLIKNHPYFAVTDDKGAFTIKNLPVGDWEFQLWHEKAGFLNAKKEWKKGRIKMKIEPGKNDLGEIKVAPELFED